MKRVARLLLLATACAVATGVALSVALPMALYAYGLEIASSRPEPSRQAIPASRVTESWREVERSEEIVVERMDPWTPLWRLFIATEFPGYRPGERACSYIASIYLHEHSGRLPTLKRHIAHYAIGVWISRHWTAEEIAREIAWIEERRLSRT